MKNRSKGLSLIELLVTLAIILVIVSIFIGREIFDFSEKNTNQMDRFQLQTFVVSNMTHPVVWDTKTKTGIVVAEDGDHKLYAAVKLLSSAQPLPKWGGVIPLLSQDKPILTIGVRGRLELYVGDIFEDTKGKVMLNFFRANVGKAGTNTQRYQVICSDNLGVYALHRINP